MMKDEKKVIEKDRWFNPFWSIWLKHLMSRPSCYKCPFATMERVADISLGDLWGVHLYCPELWGKTAGAHQKRNPNSGHYFPVLRTPSVHSGMLICSPSDESVY